MAGGRKTIGAVWREAFALLKANYWQLVGASAIVTAASLAAYFIMICVYMAVYLAIVAFTGAFLPVLMIPLAGFGVEDRDFTAAGWVGFALVFLLLLFCLAFLIVMTLASTAVSIAEQAAGVGAVEATFLVMRGDKPTLKTVLASFGRNWRRYFGVAAWSTLWTALWSLLFVVPGIAKACSYMLAPPLAVQYPDMTVRQALKKSMEITEGYRGRLFLIALIMLGFMVAGELVSCCVPFALWLAMFLWIYPLFFAMYAVAYLDIKQAAVDKGLLQSSGSSTGDSQIIEK